MTVPPRKEDDADEPVSFEKANFLDGPADGDLMPGDVYQEGPYLVFTAQYHLRRGYCCNSGCRHCPYR